jgi:hypothetical protein
MNYIIPAIFGAALMVALPWVFLFAVGCMWVWGLVPCAIVLALCCWAVWHAIREAVFDWRGWYLAAVTAAFLVSWNAMSHAGRAWL